MGKDLKVLISNLLLRYLFSPVQIKTVAAVFTALPFLMFPADAADLKVPGWEIKNPALANQFLNLWKTLEKHKREKNLPAYFALVPKFMEAKMRNHAKSVKWDDAKMSDALKSLAVSESDFQSFQVIGFKQESLSTALVVQKKEKTGGNFTFHIQSFHYEGSGWKVAEATEFQKPDVLSIAPELKKVEFLKQLPTVPQALAEAEISAAYDIYGRGFKVEWTVNGVSQSTVKSSGSGTLTGGLKKGKNTIEVVVSKEAVEHPQKDISITLRKFSDIEEKEPYLKIKIDSVGKTTREFEVK